VIGRLLLQLAQGLEHRLLGVGVVAEHEVLHLAGLLVRQREQRGVAVADALGRGFGVMMVMVEAVVEELGLDCFEPGLAVACRGCGGEGGGWN